MESKEKLGLLSVATILMLIFILPTGFLNKIPDFPWKQFLFAEDYHLWLDLKWWTHLDYRLDLSQANKYNMDDNKTNDIDIPELVEWVRSTLEKRVNGLWVSEPNIYVSQTADEFHVIVELAWVTDVEEAKAIVWKTIKLEFKEIRDKEDKSYVDEKNVIKKQADSFYSKAKKAEDFSAYWNGIQSSDWKIAYTKQLKTKDDLPEELKWLWDLKQWDFFELKEITDWIINVDWMWAPNSWYAIIKVLSKTDLSIEYEQIMISTALSQWKDTWLDWAHFKRANVIFNQAWFPLVGIEFDKEWASLFWEITWRNVWKPVAIFVGWNLISSPNVNEEILWWVAQISGNFTMKEAITLKTDLNTWAIWAPVILSGQHQVEASLWHESLLLSINAWIWWIVLLLLYMVYKYRLLGIIAWFALILYSIILLFILKNSWVIWVSIVLTLAWISGIILSIWMAVDANILIFERMKEELKDGKNVMAAVSIWFDRAWSSIRDSNISSLITCAILIWFWTSMIRWFAINLALWILISMFTAITFTKVTLQVLLPALPAKFKKYL